MSRFAPVVGKLGPQYMGGPFRKFDTGVITGVACHVSEKRLDLLAIYAKKQGQDDGTSFVAELQQHYATLIVWQVRNERLLRILHTAGFLPAKMPAGDHGALEDVYRWDCPR